MVIPLVDERLEHVCALLAEASEHKPIEALVDPCMEKTEAFVERRLRELHGTVIPQIPTTESRQRSLDLVVNNAAPTAAPEVKHQLDTLRAEIESMQAGIDANIAGRNVAGD